jgi:predicted TIM-barrel fold metal-dependent hydrolase
VEQKYVGGIRSTAELIWAGIPQRYPSLRFVIAEGGIGWIASLLGMMDHWWKDHRRWMKPRLDESPSFYFHRQFWATFEDDRAGLLTRELLPIDHLMWGSDYPHTEGTFPHSREQIAKDFAGIAEEEVRKIVAGNAARLYGLKL